MGNGCEHAVQCAFLRTNKNSKDCKAQYMIQHYCNNSNNAPLCCHQSHLTGGRTTALPWFIAPNGENMANPLARRSAADAQTTPAAR